MKKIFTIITLISFLSFFVFSITRVDIVMGAGAGVIFEDNFNVGISENLQVRTPLPTGDSWTKLFESGANIPSDMRASSVSNAATSVQSGGSKGSLYVAEIVGGTYPSANYEVEGVYVDQDTADDVMILAVRIQDENNMYALRFNATQTQLYKRVSSVWSTVGSAGDSIGVNDTVLLRIIGTTLSVRKNDIEILSETVTDHSGAGKAGLGIGAVILPLDDHGGQDLDDFTVTDLGGGAVTPIAQIRLDAQRIIIKTQGIPGGAFNTGFTEPGTATDVGGGTQPAGAGLWNTPNNALTENSVFTSNAGDTSDDDISNIIELTNYGFAIPDGSTIDGIILRTRVDVDSSDDADDQLIQLIKGGTRQGDDKKSLVDWPTTPAYRTYGGTTDKWGLTWTAADINASDFGGALQYRCQEQQDCIAGNIKLDVLALDIYYTTPPAESTIIIK